MTVARALRILAPSPVLLSAVLGLAGLSLAACGHERAEAAPGEPRPKARQVEVARAVLVEDGAGEQVVGTVRARTSASIESSIMGRVRAMPVTLGSRVRKGQLLARLSAGEIEAKAAQARAVLARASTDLERAKRLRESGAISESVLDGALAEYNVALASQSEASVLESYTEVRAPFDGVVTAKGADVGDLAVPGRSLLTVEDPTALRLEATVPEGAARALAVGARMEARVDAIAHALDATVAEVSPSADPASRTVLVKLDLPPDPALRAGLFGRLALAATPTPRLVVPEAAVLRRGQLDEVLVVDGGRARLRLVRTGRASERGVEILAGLDAGEVLVVSGAAGLVDGHLVEARP